MRLAILFDNFGPYHHARLRAAAGVGDLLAVEVAHRSGEYAWNRSTETEASSVENGRKESKGRQAWQAITLFESGNSRQASTRELAQRLDQALGAFQPQVVLVPGWASKAPLCSLRWCVAHDIPAVLMSESTAWDERRVGWKEWIKRQLVGLCSAGLAGGSPHADYLAQLGLPRERIFLGYDAVDNDYFAAKAEEIRSQKSEISSPVRPPTSDLRPLPSAPYFLVSARFIEKKNLPRLLEAYARYRQLASQTPPSSAPWSLVLLGDGSLRADLCRLISDLGLQHSVLLPGFKQYPELPAYYAHAGAFIHASTTEQWGLVVNEAMASGLPVLVSNRCGCAQDLVQDGVNGFTFDPLNVEQMAQLMLKISVMDSSSPPRPGSSLLRFGEKVSEGRMRCGPEGQGEVSSLASFGAESARLISQWGPERFAAGLQAAAECALRVGPVKSTLAQRLILKALLAR